ncbi:MAG: DUF411 domain-containing protein [Betaproteobacteria bacterium]|nr:MAG: DUF411 domain-containing protein [Betaproteobacteria bacterium]
MTLLKPVLRSVLLGLAIVAGGATAQASPKVEVFKSPYCGCCGKWVEHLRKSGFDVVTKDVDNVPAARASLGMPDRFASCHTAKVGPYSIEGHVPADDIRRLISESPKAVGLATPGMPQGSPGMETSTPQPYETLLVGLDRSATIFARH